MAQRGGWGLSTKAAVRSHQRLRTTPTAAAGCCLPLLVQGERCRYHRTSSRNHHFDALWCSARAWMAPMKIPSLGGVAALRQPGWVFTNNTQPPQEHWLAPSNTIPASVPSLLSDEASSYYP